VKVDKRTYEGIIRSIGRRRIMVGKIELVGDPVKYVVMATRVNGEVWYRILAPIRITRVPRLQPPVTQLTRSSEPNVWFLDEFDQFLTALWSRGLEYFVRLCRVRGELYFIMGVVGTYRNKHIGIRDISQKLNTMIGLLKARFPQIRYEFLREDEARIVFADNNDMTGVIIGYPSRSSTMDQELRDKMARYQFESVMRSLLQSNAKITIVAKPIKRSQVVRGLLELRKLSTEIESRIRGMDGWSFTISLPILFAQTGILTSSKVLGASSSRQIMHSKALTDIKQYITSHQISHATTSGRHNITTRTYSFSNAQSISYHLTRSQQSIHSVTHSRQYSFSIAKQYAVSVSRSYTSGEMYTSSTSQSLSLGKAISLTYQRAESLETTRSIVHTHGAQVSRATGFTIGQTFTHTKMTQQTWSKTHTEILQHSLSRTHQYSWGGEYSSFISYTQGKSSTSGWSAGVEGGLGGIGSGGGAKGGAGIFGGASYHRSSTSYSSTTTGGSFSFRYGHSISTSTTVTTGESNSITVGGSIGESWGVSRQVLSSRVFTVGRNWSVSVGTSFARGVTYGVSRGTTRSVSESFTISRARSYSHQTSYGITRTEGTVVTRGEIRGVAETRGFVSGVAETRGSAYSRSSTVGGSYGTVVINVDTSGVAEGSSRGGSHGLTYSVGGGAISSTNYAMGIVRGYTTAISGGLVPSVSFSHTREWRNVVMEGLARYLRELEKRYEIMKNVGAWKTTIYVSGSYDEVERIGGALEGALRGPISSPRIVKLVIPRTPIIQKYFNVCSQVCTDTRINDPNGFAMERNIFDTILSTIELTATCHFPRVEIQGIKIAEDIPPIFLQSPPEFSIEPDLSVGRIVDVHTGEPSRIWLRIPSTKLRHILIAGTTGSGKTNAAMWIVLQLFRKGWDIIILDWKNTWRQLLYILGKEERKRVRIYTLGKPDVNPLRLNLLEPPKGVSVVDWADTVSELFAYAYIPHPRAKSIVREELDELYFRGIPTMNDLYKAVDRRKSMIDVRVDGRGELESTTAILARLWEYSDSSRMKGKLRVFSETPTVKYEDLFVEQDANRIIIIEAAGISTNHKAFILSCLAMGIYQYYIVREPRKRPLLVVLEESNHLIPPQTILEQVHIYESVWEVAFRELREKNVHFVAITQIPSGLPKSIVMNTPFRILMNIGTAGLEAKSDVDMFLEAMSLDPRWDHRHVKRFVSRMPVGWGLVRIPYWEGQWDAWPFLVQFPLVLKGRYPSDEEVRKFVEKEK